MRRDVMSELDKYEDELGKLPAQVREVAEEWVACAMRAAEMVIKERGEVGEEADQTREFWADRIYVSVEQDDDTGPRWAIGDNYERSMFMVYYPDSDEWHSMRPYGEECLMEGAHGEAMANAEIMWHG